MMLQDILQEALTRDKDAQTNYDRLVSECVTGKPIDRTTVFPILQTANKSADDFARDVTLQSRILELDKIIATNEEVQNAHMELNATYQKAKDKLEAEQQDVENRIQQCFREFNIQTALLTSKRQTIRNAQLERNKLTELKASDEPINSLPGEYARDWNRSTLVTGAK